MCRSKDCRENSAIPTMCFFFGYLLSHGRKSKPFFSFLESQPVWCIHPDQLRYVNHKIPYIPWVQMSRVVPQRPKILGQIYPHKNKKKLTYPYQDSWHWPIDPLTPSAPIISLPAGALGAPIMAKMITSMVVNTKFGRILSASASWFRHGSTLPTGWDPRSIR